MFYSSRSIQNNRMRSYSSTADMPIASDWADVGVEPVLDWNAAALELSDGALVASWIDSVSGVAATQTVNSRRPVYKVAGLTGSPAVRFDGTDDILQAGDLSSMFPGGATLFVVAALNSEFTYSIYSTHNRSGPGVEEFWGYQRGSGYIGVFRSSRLEMYPATMPFSGSHIFALRSSPTNYQMWIDGTSKGIAAASFSAGTSHVIGGNGVTGALAGDVSRIVVFDISLSDAQIAAMNDILSNLYGVVPPVMNKVPQGGTGSVELTLTDPGMGGWPEWAIYKDSALIDSGEVGMEGMSGWNVSSADTSTATITSPPGAAVAGNYSVVVTDWENVYNGSFSVV